MKTFRYCVGKSIKSITENGKLESKRLWSKEHIITAISHLEAYGGIVMLMADIGYVHHQDYEIISLEEVK